jgi:hypothetical protein
MPEDARPIRAVSGNAGRMAATIGTILLHRDYCADDKKIRQCGEHITTCGRWSIVFLGGA